MWSFDPIFVFVLFAALNAAPARPASLAVPAPEWSYSAAVAERVTEEVAGATTHRAVAAPRSGLARRVDAAELALDGREPIDSDRVMPVGPDALVSPLQRVK